METMPNLSNKKIIFWEDQGFLQYSIAYWLQKKLDCKMYAIIDTTDRTKTFFQNQKLVNFEKIWFFHDHILKNKKPDLNNLTSAIKMISKILKINDIIFTHAGISEDFIAYESFNIENINNKMRQSIPRLKEIRKLRRAGTTNKFYEIYFGGNSLIWYRGYFEENLKETDILKILEIVDANHIVVGHTSNERVVQLYNDKIIGVDSGLKRGKYGELFLIKDDQFYRATLSGKLIKLK